MQRYPDVVDRTGLDDHCQRYLSCLSTESPMSLESLALQLGTDADYVRRQIEPQLRRQRLMTIGPGGRRLTDLGRERVSVLRSRSTLVTSLFVCSRSETRSASAAGRTPIPLRFGYRKVEL